MSGFVNRLRAARRDFAGVGRNADLRRLELAWAFSIVSTWAYSIAVVVFAFGQRAERQRLGSSDSCAGWPLESSRRSPPCWRIATTGAPSWSARTSYERR